MTDPGATAPAAALASTSEAASTSEGRGSLRHVPALDGLRGVAVAAVLVHHAGHLTGGWLGVDLFFALSGYLITTLLLDGARRHGHVELARFWSRRVRRLGPALVVTLVGVSIYGATIALRTEQLGIRWDGIATLFEVANWRTIATGGDYWSAGLRPSPLRHTWSLSIEEQLYLLWPLAIAGLLRWRRRPSVVAVAALAGAAISTALLIGLHAAGASRARLYYGTDTRATALLLGAAVAATRLHLGPGRWAESRPLRQGLGAVAAAGLLLAWFRLDGASDLPYQGVLPLASLGAALVVAALADRRHPGPLGRALSVTPLTELGRISYGLYLYHWPIFLVLDESRTGLSGWPLVVVQVAVSVAVAWVSYRYLERPVRDGALAGRQARAAVPAAAALAVIALLVGSLGALPRVATGGAGGLQAGPAGAPVVLVAGDSVPLLLGVELGEQRDELGISVVNKAAPGCHLLAADGPIRGVEGDVRTDVADCSADHTYRQAVDEFRPDVAVVLFGEFPNEAVRIDGAWVMPCQEAYLDALRRRLGELVDDLRTDDTPVVLVTAPGSSVSWVLDRVEPGMAERVTCTNQLLRDLADERDGVDLVDLDAYVCPGGACRNQIDGIDLRPDTLHFQGDSAALVNRWLVPQALALAGAG